MMSMHKGIFMSVFSKLMNIFRLLNWLRSLVETWITGIGLPLLLSYTMEKAFNISPSHMELTIGFTYMFDIRSRKFLSFSTQFHLIILVTNGIEFCPMLSSSIKRTMWLVQIMWWLVFQANIPVIKTNCSCKKKNTHGIILNS